MGLTDRIMDDKLFDGKTENYEKSRPSVSPKALEYLYSLLPSNAVFADIGAGTGKFTSLIAERENLIYAVEPNLEMYSALKNKLGHYSNVKILNTCAEATEIPSNSIDVVVTVTALHWFDLSKFRAECLRILKPGGFVVVIYNSQKSELRKKSNNQKEKTATDIFFNDKYECIEFSNQKTYSLEKYIAYYLSHASAPTPKDENYDTYLERIISNFKQNSINNSYLFDFVSVLYIDKDFIKNHSQ